MPRAGSTATINCAKMKPAQSLTHPASCIQQCIDAHSNTLSSLFTFAGSETHPKNYPAQPRQQLLPPAQGWLFAARCSSLPSILIALKALHKALSKRLVLVALQGGDKSRTEAAQRSVVLFPYASVSQELLAQVICWHCKHAEHERTTAFLCCS